MKATTKKTRFISVPSWALSLMAVVLISVIVGILNGQVKSIGDNIRYMIWATLTVILFIHLLE